MRSEGIEFGPVVVPNKWDDAAATMRELDGSKKASGNMIEAKDTGKRPS